MVNQKKKEEVPLSSLRIGVMRLPAGQSAGFLTP